jgi:transcriptional regulator with XRE-family HTH domain
MDDASERGGRMAVLMREAIGDSLRKVRTARRRTLRDVSRAARVSLGYLSEVERGRKEPSSELLAAICEALDLALHELLSEAAESMAAEVLRDAARARRPVGLRHMDLRLAGSQERSGPLPTPGAVPVTAPVAAPLPGLRPLGPVEPAAVPSAPRAAGRVRVAA